MNEQTIWGSFDYGRNQEPIGGVLCVGAFGTKGGVWDGTTWINTIKPGTVRKGKVWTGNIWVDLIFENVSPDFELEVNRNV